MSGAAAVYMRDARRADVLLPTTITYYYYVAWSAPVLSSAGWSIVVNTWDEMKTRFKNYALSDVAVCETAKSWVWS